VNRFISVTAFTKKGNTVPVLLSADAIVSMEYATRPRAGGEGTRLTMLDGSIFFVREPAAEIFNGNPTILSFSA